ncbi:hypothetical protein QE152_g27837 [Popillia japonica]|uniref:GST N-terminal domain-containing protein n=1 Tax=Popillia japonica TaxID=7064 RepID=A0AAW1JKV0_POPJA
MQNDTVIPIFTADKSAANNTEKMNGGEDDEQGTIDFYYFPPSPPCRSVISVMLLARTLGIELNLKLVNVLEGEQMNPEYLKVRLKLVNVLEGEQMNPEYLKLRFSKKTQRGILLYFDSDVLFVTESESKTKFGKRTPANPNFTGIDYDGQFQGGELNDWLPIRR